MYSNSYFCDSVEYVRENLLKKEVIEYVELPSDKLPEHIYQDDPKRFWEIWKKHRGYKLYTVDSLASYKSNILKCEDVPNGMVRLYRTTAEPIHKSF